MVFVPPRLKTPTSFAFNNWRDNDELGAPGTNVQDGYRTSLHNIPGGIDSLPLPCRKLIYQSFHIPFPAYVTKCAHDEG